MLPEDGRRSHRGGESTSTPPLVSPCRYSPMAAAGRWLAMMPPRTPPRYHAPAASHDAMLFSMMAICAADILARCAAAPIGRRAQAAMRPQGAVRCLLPRARCLSDDGQHDFAISLMLTLTPSRRLPRHRLRALCRFRAIFTIHRGRCGHFCPRFSSAAPPMLGALGGARARRRRELLHFGRGWRALPAPAMILPMHTGDDFGFRWLVKKGRSGYGDFRREYAFCYYRLLLLRYFAHVHFIGHKMAMTFRCRRRRQRLPALLFLLVARDILAPCAVVISLACPSAAYGRDEAPAAR